MTGDFGRPTRPATSVAPQRAKNYELRNALVAVAAGLLALVYVVQAHLGGQWVFAPLIWAYVVPGAGGAIFLALTGITRLIAGPSRNTVEVTS